MVLERIAAASVVAKHLDVESVEQRARPKLRRGQLLGDLVVDAERAMPA